MKKGQKNIGVAAITLLLIVCGTNVPERGNKVESNGTMITEMEQFLEMAGTGWMEIMMDMQNVTILMPMELWHLTKL